MLKRVSLSRVWLVKNVPRDQPGRQLWRVHAGAEGRQCRCGRGTRLPALQCEEQVEQPGASLKTTSRGRGVEDEVLMPCCEAL